MDWEWLWLDGVMTKASFGSAVTGANPTDRGNRRAKRSTRCEGHGLPIVVVAAVANVPDMKLVAPTLDAQAVLRPDPTAAQPQQPAPGCRLRPAPLCRRAALLHRLNPSARRGPRLRPIAWPHQTTATLDRRAAAQLARSHAAAPSPRGEGAADLRCVPPPRLRARLLSAVRPRQGTAGYRTRP